MKSTVENLGPTRVRLAVEVPFEELQPSLTKAYRDIAQQIRIPGFRPGKAPARLIDQRVGRAAVLQEAVNEAIPQQYSAAVQEHQVKVVGQPEVEVTELDDGAELKFTAEVDIRPEIELPAYDSLTVTLDDVAVTDEEIDEQLAGLRERFAMLTAVERPVQRGDFVSIDLHATVDGQDVEGGSTTGLSYEVGTDGLLPGIDDVLVGMQAGDSHTFQTELVSGEFAGRTADVSVTVRSVKEKDLPALDDDFAQTASEFDTIEELRSDMRSRLQRVKRMQQAFDARDKVVAALLDSVEIPLPESVVQAELDYRRHALEHELEHNNVTLEAYLASENRTQEQLESELEEAARQAVKSQLILDAAADKDEVGVTDTELTQELVRRAQQAGIAPDQYAQQLVDAGQVPLLAADVRRGKALASVLEQAVILDAAGNRVDLETLQREVRAEFDDMVQEDRELTEDWDEEGADEESGADDATTATAVGETAESETADPETAEPETAEPETAEPESPDAAPSGTTA